MCNFKKSSRQQYVTKRKRDVIEAEIEVCCNIYKEWLFMHIMS